MVVTLLVSALVLASLPSVARPIGSRLPVREWALLCLAALVGAALLVEVALVTWATPAVLDAIGLHRVAQACASMLGIANTAGWAGSAFAFSAAVVLPAVGFRAAARLRMRIASLRIEPELGLHDHRDGFDVVTLPTAQPLAYSVEGTHPQVVLSTGLVASLTDDQLAAVIAHERAHLRHGHGRLLRAGAIAASVVRWWPPAERSHLALRAAIERWADDCAAGTSGVSRQALRSALIDVVMSDPPLAIPALSLAATTAERIAALDGIAPITRAARISLYVPGTLTAAVTMLTVASCMTAIPAWETIRACCSI